MSKIVLALSVLIQTALVESCNLNLGTYKMHNGNGEMSYMDREKSALYAEQGVWVSWKVPVPKHWDPKTGQIRTENPGKAVGQNWYHVNQIADDNPPLRTPSPAEEKAFKSRVTAPDPYREFLRSKQRNPSYGRADEDVFFLSAGFDKESGTNVDMGVLKGNKPKMPAAYMGALKGPSFNFKPDDYEEGPKATRAKLTTTEAASIVLEPVMANSEGGSGAVIETDKTLANKKTQ